MSQSTICGGWRATVCPPQQASPVCAARWRDSTTHCERGGQTYLYFIQERAHVALFQIPLVEADKKMNGMGNKQLGGMQWNHFTVVCASRK